jgi:hypothetical protein
MFAGLAQRSRKGRDLVNYKFLPIGGTDLWAHYPVAGTFAEESEWLPAAEASVPAWAEARPAPDQPAPATGEDRMIGSPRAAGAPADDWMIGSPRAVGEPPLETWQPAAPCAPTEEADPALLAARARYEEASAALDERAYHIPFNDSTMAAPVH